MRRTDGQTGGRTVGQEGGRVAARHIRVSHIPTLPHGRGGGCKQSWVGGIPDGLVVLGDCYGGERKGERPGGWFGQMDGW